MAGSRLFLGASGGPESSKAERLLDLVPHRARRDECLVLRPWESSWGLPSPSGLMVFFSKSSDILINNRGA